jgi:NAD-dependent dihydropyrimidine dehydrogenase PreA subunit
MPIDPGFPKNHQAVGKHRHSDGQHFHFVWGPGRLAEAAENEQVQKAYESRGEKIVPLGVHGTTVAIDWDSCVADGACIEACPVQVYQWYRSEQDVPAADMKNATSAGTGDDRSRDGRKDYTDKSDPIRDYDCIWCMACVSVCPTQAVKVDQSNVQYHEKAVATFAEA